MANSKHKKEKASEEKASQFEPFFSHKSIFSGFAPPVSNTLYCPNQYFDVVLRNGSTGCVRFVSYILRKTLGWADSEGNPQNEQVLITRDDFITHAAISNGAVDPAADEAITKGYALCARKGHRSARGQTAISPLYELRWDDREQYNTNALAFQGFYPYEGNRTYIPNEFFDVLVRQESLSVIKVVGCMMRNTIGWAYRGGHRRQEVPMGFTEIQKRTGIKSRSTVSIAMRRATEANYIITTREGFFDPNAGRDSKPATYSIKWLDTRSLPLPSPKIEPGRKRGTSPKIEPGISSKKHSKNRTGASPKTGPENLSRNRTDIEITNRNNISKQQQTGRAGQDAVADIELVSLLQQQGFRQADAYKLATAYPEDVIRHQIEWLPLRSPSKNPVGLLRKSIEENWSEPKTPNVSVLTSSLGQAFAANFYSGLANHDGDPIAQPSSKEIGLAERYAKRLLQIWKDETRAPEWGRDFGKYVAEQLQGKKDIIPTLSFALNSTPYGEQFLKQFTAHRRSQLRLEVAQKKEQHQKKYRNAYFAYLKSESDRLKQDSPDQMKAFENSRSQKRTEILGYRFITNEESRKKMLDNHDSSKTRRADFAEFFKYDFWTWDHDVNLDSFSSGEQTS